MKDKPFALIGINVMRRDPASLKQVMDDEELNWRSFADHGPITTQWNNPPTPSFYILDHEGVIRFKWFGHPGEETIDAALEKLIHEAEGSDTPE